MRVIGGTRQWRAIRKGRLGTAEDIICAYGRGDSHAEAGLEIQIWMEP